MFSPKYLKDGKMVARNAAKLLCYKRDLLSETEIAEMQARIEALQGALKSRDRAAVAKAVGEVEERFAKAVPPKKDAGWRENVEVVVVAVVIAVAVRSYFLQPFTIPTGSMQPTLNGVLATKMEAEPPNFVVKALHFALLGRSYVNVVSEMDDKIVGLQERPFLRFFKFTTIQCERQRFRVYGQAQTLARDFNVLPGRPLAKGEIVARGHIDTGDHVFVDKMSYNFRFPKRAEVFVFKTTGITRIERSFTSEGSQYYIKRLAGLPGDTLQIDPPVLSVNGKPAAETGLARVIASKDGYAGYSNAPAGGNSSSFLYLTRPGDKYEVPPKSYFALGDNSFHSFDSRGWGIVPERNVVGRGMFVYWPFTRHWGLID